MLTPQRKISQCTGPVVIIQPGDERSRPDSHLVERNRRLHVGLNTHFPPRKNLSSSPEFSTRSTAPRILRTAQWRFNVARNVDVCGHPPERTHHVFASATCD